LAGLSLTALSTVRKLSVVAKFGEAAFDRNLGDGIAPRILEHNANDLAICQSNASRTRAESLIEHVSPALYPAVIGAGEVIDIAVDLVNDGAVALLTTLVQKFSIAVKSAEVLKRTPMRERLHQIFSMQ
jgi:hypothetical protein